MRAQREAEELSQPRVRAGEQWGDWVPGLLVAKFSESPATLLRAQNAWRPLAAYFRAKSIRSPRLLDRAACIDYVGWRCDAEKTREWGLRRAQRNTALLELKILSGIMREAVNRGLCAANPCLQLGLKRAKAKVKPEITDEEFERIESALVLPDELARPYSEALRISWQIAMRQVCRLSETCVPLRDVNLDEGTITFVVKGGREHTQLIHHELLPLFRKLKEERREFAFTMPGNFSRKWQDFFERHGMEHLTFHCTRVTGATRLRRAGVDQRTAQEFVGHSSTLIHRIYVRERREDQVAALNALSRSPSSKSSGSQPST